MSLFDTISAELATLVQSLDECVSFQDGVSRFEKDWSSLGRTILEASMQARIERVESEHVGSRQIRRKDYHTRLGTITLRRRVYDSPAGSVVRADELLVLPEDAWHPDVLELACVLGVSSEFPNAHRMFRKLTGVDICEKTLANQVEKVGERLNESEKEREPHETAPLDSVLGKVVTLRKPKPRIYVGMDGIFTRINRGHGYKEARVGVVFRESDHWQMSEKRSEIRQKEYVATLESRESFAERLYQVYTETVGMLPVQTVVLGDGAAWIWETANTYFPGAIEILDFFHVSEYVWAVARSAFADADKQKEWAQKQQDLLKKSEWRAVIQNLKEFEDRSSDLNTVCDDLKRYLTNNETRIDYKRFLDEGLMIGSGVVESSNRRIVTQRLKQAGMQWSIYGAKGVMGLRAAYLSTSDRWNDFWKRSLA